MTKHEMPLNDCRQNTFKESSLSTNHQIIWCIQTVCWWHNCCDSWSPHSVQSSAWEWQSNYCWLCASHVISIKDQLKPDRLSSGFDTKQTPAPQALSLCLSHLFAQTLQQGQELLMVRMMAEMMMKTTETVLPFSLVSLSYSLPRCSFCVSTSQNDQKAIKLQTRE